MGMPFYGFLVLIKKVAIFKINIQFALYSRMVCADNLRHYNYEDLSIGTKRFSEDMELGHGGFGSVYKCYLREVDETVAVKRLRLERVAVRGLEEIQFRTEVLTLSKLSHPNLLSLVGYSCDGPHLCLMYPFMVNGSLQDRIECKVFFIIFLFIYFL